MATVPCMLREHQELHKRIAKRREQLKENNLLLDILSELGVSSKYLF